MDKPLVTNTVNDTQFHQHQSVPNDCNTSFNHEEKTTYSRTAIGKEQLNTPEVSLSRIIHVPEHIFSHPRQRNMSYISMRYKMRPQFVQNAIDKPSVDANHKDNESTDEDDPGFTTTIQCTANNTTALHISSEELSEMSGCVECVKAIHVFSEYALFHYSGNTLFPCF